jgi:peptidoglycan/xylan/chitin deacetylase (PgdA/CDA1 family)
MNGVFRTDAGPLWSAQGLRSFGRRSAKAVAQHLLPRSVAVWRGAEARHCGLGALRYGWRTNATAPGRVALTFDDGPAPLTHEYLKVLAALDARATFFLVGEMCVEYPELVRAIAGRGHEIAGHGYTHRRFTSLTRAELEAELWRTAAVLPPTRAAHKLVRPPYGAVSLGTLATCARHGFTSVMWSLNSGDWRARSAPDVAKTFVQAVAPGEIVLLHEGQPWTLDALPTILENLRKWGHELVTVSELLA